MAYPPLQHGDLYDNLLPPFMEQIPQDGEKARWVHFDIDPQNGKVDMLQDMRRNRWFLPAVQYIGPRSTLLTFLLNSPCA
jgi:hypothetical protein